MRQFIAFYIHVLKVAATHTIEKAHGIIFVAVILSGMISASFPLFRPAVLLRFPFLKDVEGPESWQSLLFAVVIVVLMRLVAAPFWIFQEEKKKRAKVEVQLSELINKTNDSGKRKLIRSKLAEFMNRAERIMNEATDLSKNQPISEVDTLAVEMSEFLRENLDGSYIARINSRAGILPMVPSLNIPPERVQLWQAARLWVVRLHEFVIEFSRN